MRTGIIQKLANVGYAHGFFGRKGTKPILQATIEGRLSGSMLSFANHPTVMQL